MRWMIVAVLTLAATVWTLPGTASAYTSDDLAAAALTAGDLGQGFTSLQAGPVDQITTLGVANHMVVFSKAPTLRDPTVQVVVSLLADGGAIDAAALDPTSLVQGLDTLKSFGIQQEQVEAPAIGENAVMFKLSGSLSGTKLSGDLIMWRCGAIVSAMITLGNGTPTSVPYAMKLQDRLSALPCA